MTIALVVLGALLGAAAAGSGIAKLAKVPQVMESMASVGVSPRQVPALALLEIAGAAGLAVGIASKPLAIAAATCLALYFLGAVASHVRKRHTPAEYGPALGIFIIAVAVTALQVAR